MQQLGLVILVCPILKMTKRYLPLLLCPTTFLFYTADVYAGVNGNTGAMFLEEELFQIKNNSVQLSVTLDYHSGIKLDERASWVGLGFDISLPYIERIPFGSADEKAGDGAFGYTYNAPKRYRKLLKDDGNGYQREPAEDDFTGQQDTYLLSAPFASGRIVFAEPKTETERMQAYLQNWRKAPIKYEISDDEDDPDITSWSITDEKGITYVFGAAVRMVTKRNPINIIHPARNAIWDRVDAHGVIYVQYGTRHANESYVHRWYLTEIRGPNYTKLTSSGDVIKIEYGTEGDPIPLYDASSFWLNNRRSIPDQPYYAEDNATHFRMDWFTQYTKIVIPPENTEDSPTLGEDGEDDAQEPEITYHSTVSFHHPQNIQYLLPRYPKRITSSYSRAEFRMSESSDYNRQGKQKIDAIELYTGDVHTGTIKFEYAEYGLGKNHPYSPESNRGRLCLNSVSKKTANGGEISLLKFDYEHNPDIDDDLEGLLKRDFCGYYNHQSLSQLHKEGGFAYPEGLSNEPDGNNAWAAAWSVTKVSYGDGRIEEYEYEPAVANRLTTGSKLDKRIQCGIRVKTSVFKSTPLAEPIETKYSYSFGYCTFTRVLENDVEGFYGWLNAGEFAEACNINVLNGVSIEYSNCEKSTVGSGSVDMWFVGPRNSVKNADGPGTFYLNDRVSPITGGVERLGFLRGQRRFVGQSWVASASYTNEAVDMVEYYTYPIVPTSGLWHCIVGEGDFEEIEKPEEDDNRGDKILIGYNRPTKVEHKKDNVKWTETTSYNAYSGLPSSYEKTHHDVTGLREEIRYASSYELGMDSRNMHNYIAQITTKERPSGKVVAAKAVSYTPFRGALGYQPKAEYYWVGVDTKGDVVPFEDYKHEAAETTPGWRLARSFIDYNIAGKPIVTHRPLYADSLVIYRNDFHLAIGAVLNSEHQEASVFTGDYKVDTDQKFWDRYNGWEKGTTNTAEITPDVKHFGQKCVHVIDDYAAGRNNRIYPGKGYVMSAWVKVTSGTINMAADFRYAESDDGWPEISLTTVARPKPVYTKSITADDCDGEWKLMVLEIPSEVTNELSQTMRDQKLDAKTTVWYARTWVGDDPNHGNFEAYVDDVRFYPENAMLTSTYYDEKWLTPILTVDENNNPGRLVKYDGFGRKTKIYRVNKHDPASNKLLRKTEYHRVGDVVPE